MAEQAQIAFSSFILEMVSGHHTNHHSQPDAFTNVMQGKVLSIGNSLPKLLWNQMKILIVANKDGERALSARLDSTRSFSLEFDLEREMLVNETLPRLQQYFLTQGIYVNFLDCNLNWDYDLSRNPYHVLRYMKELDDANRTSSGLFLLVCVYSSVLSRHLTRSF